MSPGLVFARRVASILGLLLLFLAGCLPIAYVFPTVGFIPPRPVGAPCDEVRAFRVDVARSYGGVDPVRMDQATLAEIPFSSPGRVPGQTRLALAHGQLDRSGSPPVRDWSWSGTHPAVELHLYRPGWRTVRIRAWEWPEQVEWEPASTPAEQEKAIDQLLFAPDAPRLPPNSEALPEKQPGDLGNTMFDWDGTSAALARGSASTAHREALLFAVAEYERLASVVGSAATPPAAADEGQRMRLILKAQRLRTLADE